jgi:hypothetical protein
MYEKVTLIICQRTAARRYDHALGFRVAVSMQLDSHRAGELPKILRYSGTVTCVRQAEGLWQFLPGRVREIPTLAFSD